MDVDEVIFPWPSQKIPSVFDTTEDVPFQSESNRRSFDSVWRNERAKLRSE
jgi:hypothetical protein